jgi:hypothetical protein
MIKWRLMITTLPIVIILTAIKIGMDLGFNFAGLIKFSDIAIILTGGVFLIGFMLAGVLADFKESEKLPGDIMASLEVIDEGLCHISAAKQNVQVPEIRRWVMELADVIDDWLYKKVKSDKVYEAISQLSGKVRPLDSTALGIRVLNELNALRKTVTRIDVISRTSFLQSGYALLDSIVGLVLLLVMVSKFDSQISEGMVTFFVSLIYIYMIRLIRDIDDPFEYREGGQKGAAEVELFPLKEFRQRLQGRA